jgi:hypothetical protein
MHDRFCPARSTAALAAAFALAAALVGHTAAAPVLAAPVVTLTADAAAGSSSDKAADKAAGKAALIVPQSAETVLGEIQQQLAIVMSKSVAPGEHVDALARALFAARGGVKDQAVVSELAAAVAGVIARGSLPGELLERLAQNLYAAAHPRQLTAQEASLLALDVALLLQESGGTTDDVAAVLTPLGRLCPGASLPGGGQMPKPTASSAHRPAPRVLSVLTRPASGS